MRDLRGYKIELSGSARKDLKSLETKIVLKIENKLNALTLDSQNLDIKKLEGVNIDLLRLRCGDYRIIFEIDDSKSIIYIIAIDHRKDIYKGLSILITWLTTFFS